MSEFKKLLEKAFRGEPLDEVSPPGFKGTVKAMKDEPEIDNPYALCLAKGTRIPCLDGKNRNVEDMIEGTYWLYSLNPDNLTVVPGLSHVTTTGVKKCLEITLDNGNIIKSTPEHKWMMRSGEYKRTDELIEGDSLMPFKTFKQSRNKNGTEHEQVYHPGLCTYGFTHHAVAASGKNFPKDGNDVLHHLNENSLDNRPENLKWVNKLQHNEHHKVKRIEALREKNSGDNNWSKSEKGRASSSNVMRRNWKDPNFRAKMTEINRRNAKKGGEAAGKVHKRKAEERRAAQNHKILSIRDAGELETYDVSVDVWHNFAIESGVFSHNSWWMKKKGYKSHKKASGADKNEAVGDSSGADPTYEMLKRTAQDFIESGMSPEQVEAHAQQMRPKFDASADYQMAVAAIMRRLLGQQTETLGGGKVTDVPLTDARGSSGMAAHREGETSGYVATTDYQAYAGNQARGEAANSDLKLPGHEDEFSEETGDNWSTTDGPGATGMTAWVATDALPEMPLQYDMDLEKLPESFDFSLMEVKKGKTLASTKGIKLVDVPGDDDGKKTKFTDDPDDAPRPDYRQLGAKDVKDADNLSDEAINDTMKNSAYETVRVDHVTKGKGTVLEIGESFIIVDWDRSSLRILGPERLPLSETKYLTRIKERYSDDPEDAEVDKQIKPKGKKKMAKKKQKVDEAWMSAIKSTMRDTSDGYKLPVIDLSPADIGLINEYDLPDPGDSVLTGQDQQKAPQIEPLSTERGADAAHDDIYPDGDFATDLVPDDAPGVPTYDKMGDEAGNTRSVDASSERPSADVGSNSSGKSDDIKPKNYDEREYGDQDKDTGYDAKNNSDDDSDDDEDKDMKEGLTWEDIGLNITEMAYEDETCEGCGDYMGETHDTAAGDIGMTCDLLKKLLSAVRDQSPDDSMMEFICTGISEASREKGATLDEADIGMIMGEIKEAAKGGVDLDADQEMAGAHGDDYDDPNSVGGPDDYEAESYGGESNEAGDARGKMQGHKSSDPEGARDDKYKQHASKYHGKAWAHEEEGDDEYEDKAAGDGEEAGPEGGKEHEGKTKLMDKKGKDQDKDGDIDSDDWKISRDKAIKRSKERRGARHAKQARKYGESKGEPKQDNFGGDNKRKSEKGKSGTPIGSKKGSGPGGGNTSNAGQSPLIPEVPDGSQLGAHGTPISKEGGGRTVDPISESMVAVGMAGIGGTVRNFDEHPDDDGLTADEKELRMIKRRAGIEDWWK